MITIARLRMRNWKCYRGEHTLDLEPKPYAIFAEQQGDPGRSNWLGKSSIPEAIDFAIYGRLPEEFRARKRGWISRGEKSGEVEVVLSDGSSVKRSQHLTGSEKVWYFPPGNPQGGAVQAEAQKRIDELVGLSREDFAATRYFRQGEMSRLITLDPGPRLDLVAGWLGLGSLQECEDDAAEALREVARRRDEACAAERTALEAAVSHLERVGAKGEEHAEQLARELDAQLAEARLRANAADRVVERFAEFDAARAGAEAYDRAVAHGKLVSDEIKSGSFLRSEYVPEPGAKLDRKALETVRNALAAQVDGLVSRVRKAASYSGELSGAARARRTVATGSFDGTCPLLGEACPARAHVESRGLLLREGAEKASREAEEASAQFVALDGERQAAAARLSKFDVLARRLGELREEAARHKADKGRWEALSREIEATAAYAREQVESARAELLRLSGEVTALGRAREAELEFRGRAREAGEKAAHFERAVRVAAAAAAVFGKGGAQRRMAEGELAEIEDRANRELALAGLSLSVRVVWSREGSGVASTCAACGDAFPRSEKVKSCARCGESRGPNLVNRLEIEPSSQSGGARDLAGVFVQFAAAAWLVEERGARWATAMLDEPLAALDATNRRALSSHLTGILRRCGCEQALVIGHDRGALDALPGRIRVVSKDGWSAASVVA